jgi:hypothetical protein
LEREAMKSKFEISRMSEDRESLSKESARYKEELNTVRGEARSTKSEVQKLSKALSRQK